MLIVQQMRKILEKMNTLIESNEEEHSFDFSSNDFLSRFYHVYNLSFFLLVQYFHIPKFKKNHVSMVTFDLSSSTNLQLSVEKVGSRDSRNERNINCNILKFHFRQLSSRNLCFESIKIKQMKLISYKNSMNIKFYLKHFREDFRQLNDFMHIFHVKNRPI